MIFSDDNDMTLEDVDSGGGATEEEEPNMVAVETLRKRLDELTKDNSKLKKDNIGLKDKLAKTITVEQVQRLRADNKRLLGLTERLNNQRSTMEERFKEKKSEVVELERQVAQRNEDIDQIITDRDKLKILVENLLKEIEQQKAEIQVLKDGKTFADFVELKRQIKELKDENLALSNGLKSDRKGSVKFNLNDIATMLRLKHGGDAFTQRVQNHRVVVLDERELEDSIRRSEQQVPPEITSPVSPSSPTHRPLTSRQSSVNRINFISPPRSLATSPRIFSRQSSKENGSGQTPRRVSFAARRRSSPRWPSLSELNERYQLALQGAWTNKPSIEEVSEYIKKRQNVNELENS